MTLKRVTGISQGEVPQIIEEICTPKQYAANEYKDAILKALEFYGELDSFVMTPKETVAVHQQMEVYKTRLLKVLEGGLK